MKIGIALKIFLLSPFLTLGQQTVDTVSIYKSQTNKFGDYMEKWFFRPGNYSGSARRMSKQDSMVLAFISKPKYYKIYDSKNKLFMEGYYDGDRMQGDIKYYYPSGKIKRIEHWDNELILDTCGIKIQMHDSYQPEGIWKYFRLNGTLEKTVSYVALASSCKPLVYCKISITTTFDSNGKQTGRRTKRIDCSE